MKKKAQKNIFVSSTISDLKNERRFIKKHLEEFVPITIKCYQSEVSDFPVQKDKLLQSTYDICLSNLLECDYVILLLKIKYGVDDIQDGNELISIVHKEIRLAIRKHKPLYVFVYKDLWDKYKEYKSSNSLQRWNDTELKLFGLLIEIEGMYAKRWLFRYSRIKDIQEVIDNSILRFDDSIFVADVTYPDGETITFNKEFTKIWEIRNNGMVVWQDRFLKEINPGNGLKPSKQLVPIRQTHPGESVQIAVDFITPSYECTCVSKWKMVYRNGNICFPHRTPIFCKVKVVIDCSYV